MAKVYIMDFDGFWLVYSVMHCCFTFFVGSCLFYFGLLLGDVEGSRDYQKHAITTIITTYM